MTRPPAWSLHLASWLLAASIVGATGMAHAQDARQEARQIAQQATRDYNLGRFQAALEAYERAYERYPADGLLFNLGQCHRELGHHERATFFFERYLEEVPDSPNRALVLDLIAEARAAGARARAEEEAALTAGSTLLDAQRQRQAHALAELESARVALESARDDGRRSREAERARYEAALAELEQARVELERARLAVENDRPDELPSPTLTPVAVSVDPMTTDASDPEVYEEWWFWTIIAGVVAVGVGLTVGLTVGLEPGLPAGSLGTIDAR